MNYYLKENLVDSFQHTLDYDTTKINQLETENNIEERIVNNLRKLTEEYCVDQRFNEEKYHISMERRMRQEKVSDGYRRKESLLNIERIMKEYYMLMESLEFRMERHEQLTKLAQKSIKFTLIEQENRTVAMKK